MRSLPQSTQFPGWMEKRSPEDGSTPMPLLPKKCSPDLPIIGSLDPDNGPEESPVTINGTAFGTSYGTVTFNTTPATATSWSDTAIITSVPVGATTGLVVVTTGESVSAAGVEFTVTTETEPPPPPPSESPVIEELDSYSGAPGSTVVISGLNFGDSKGRVTFNGKNARVKSWSAGSISAVVPRKAKSGPLKVITANGETSEGVDFTVTK